MTYIRNYSIEEATFEAVCTTQGWYHKKSRIMNQKVVLDIKATFNKRRQLYTVGTNWHTNNLWQYSHASEVAIVSL